MTLKSDYKTKLLLWIIITPVAPPTPLTWIRVFSVRKYLVINFINRGNPTERYFFFISEVEGVNSSTTKVTWYLRIEKKNPCFYQLVYFSSSSESRRILTTWQSESSFSSVFPLFFHCLSRNRFSRSGH